MGGLLRLYYGVKEVASMARKRSPARDEARAIWEQDKERPLVSIAGELGIPEARVRKWKCEDKWERPAKGNVPKCEKERSVSKDTEKKLIASVEQNEELTDKQRAFCLYYVMTFNATRAYQKAYGCSYAVANAHGWELLSNVVVRDEIARLKALRSLDLMAGPDDVVMLHMRIAFADITDFVEFGRATVPVMGPFGPIVVKDDNGDKYELTKEINEVRFRESSEIDGQLISKVKQGRDGASVELADRQKSLSFLERWFELNPMDKHRKAYDEARLEMERRKQGDGDEIEDDGFIDALKNSAKEVWSGENQGDIPV